MAKASNHIDALKGKPAPVLLMDATGLVFRAFFSIRELTTRDGMPINAVFGTLKMILKVVNDVQPKGCAAFFDTARRTFRSEQFADYKANRPAPPDDLIHQFPLVVEAMLAMLRSTRTPSRSSSRATATCCSWWMTTPTCWCSRAG